MCCICLRGEVVELELQRNCTCFVDRKKKSQPNQKGKCDQTFSNYKTKKLFFVFCIVLKHRDSFVKSFSYPKF